VSGPEVTTEEPPATLAKPEPSPDPDEALRTAIKAAVDAGDFARVEALVAVLKGDPAKLAPVVPLASRGRVRGA
jgi:hypothetical protein